MNHTKIKNIAFVSVGAVIIAVSALLTIPFAVPFTLQTFGVFFVLLMFGGKRGVLSIAVYLSLGLVGVPVFSGFGAGFGVLFGPTGGYLLGFLLFAFVFWALEKHLKNDSRKILALALGMVIYYAFGTAFFILWSDTKISLISALSACVLPFLLTDIVKVILAFVAYKRACRLV